MKLKLMRSETRFLARRPWWDWRSPQLLLTQGCTLTSGGSACRLAQRVSVPAASRPRTGASAPERTSRPLKQYQSPLGEAQTPGSLCLPSAETLEIPLLGRRVQCDNRCNLLCFLTSSQDYWSFSDMLETSSVVHAMGLNGARLRVCTPAVIRGPNIIRRTVRGREGALAVRPRVGCAVLTPVNQGASELSFLLI